jgi:amidase
MDDPITMSAQELVDALRGRHVSSRELLAHFLRRIGEDGGSLNAVVTVDEDRAYAEALAADEALIRGESVGLLHGLPMTVKDTIETAGMRTTSGSPELAGHIPHRDADAVARLRASGAVIFGKTNVPPFATDFQTANPLFGVTTNPWDPARTPGGSAGGAAAALAAGHTGFELGSDLAGSIRIPAANCGVYGLRPSHGVVPARGHIPGPPGSLAVPDLAVLGPMGRGSDDLALGLDVLAGPDEATAVGWRLQLPRPRAASLPEYRIAAWLDDPACPVGADVRKVMATAVEALRSAGARIDEPVPPVPLADSDLLFQQVLAGVTAAYQPQPVIDFMQAIADSGDSRALPAVQWARWVTQRVRDWHEARERRAQWAQRWATFFRDHDVLLCPVSFTPAIPHDHTPDPTARIIRIDGQPRPYLAQSIWPGLATVVDLPAAAVPVGVTAAGLPVGIQVIGPHLEDRTVVTIARHLERVLGRLTLKGVVSQPSSGLVAAPQGP